MKYKSALAIVFIFTCLQATAQGNWGLDNNFGINGKVITPLPPTPGQKGACVSMIQPDGKIIVGGNTYVNRHIVLMRFHPDGSLDNTFGMGGIVETGAGPWNSISEISAIALQPNGKIVVAGQVDNPTHMPIGNYDFLLCRYNMDGSPDITFGLNGEVITDVGNEENNTVSIILQPDGKILLGGSVYFATAIIRYNIDGSLDATFGTNGVNLIQLHSTEWSSVASLTLQPDGKIIGGGYIPDSAGGYDLVLSRLNSDGSLDAGFGTNGLTSLDAGSLVETIKDILLQPDGKILAGGFGVDSANYEDCLLARWLPDGTPDNSFGTNGVAVKSWSNESDFISAIALQPDGKIITTGGFYTGATLSAVDHDFAVIRYQANGVPDTGFGNLGIIISDFGSNYDISKDVCLQSDGKIVVVGERGTNPSFALARYTPTFPSNISMLGNERIKKSVAYPNPLEGSAMTVAYELSEPGPVSLHLLSVSGACITSFLRNQPRFSGRNEEVILLPDDLAAGVYQLRVTCNGNVAGISILKK